MENIFGILKYHVFIKRHTIDIIRIFYWNYYLCSLFCKIYSFYLKGMFTERRHSEEDLPSASSCSIVVVMAGVVPT